MTASPGRRILLEVCVASAEDALTAYRAGADRLELNTALELGGLTPSAGLLRAVKAAAPLPVITMIRPRPGGFGYSDADVEVMRVDIAIARQYESDGIAFGILNADGTIDVDRCRTLREGAGPGQVVFHRAFDVTPDPFRALEQLIDLGFTRVLTSGQRPRAVDGADLIRRLIDAARGRIEILPAAGINRQTVIEVVRATGCDQVHGSFRGRKSDPSTAGRPEIRFDELGGGYGATAFDEVSAVRACLNQLAGPY